MGMEITQNNTGVFISQSKYAANILKKCKLDCCKEISTHLIVIEKVSKDDGEKLEDPTIYRSLVGSLLYLTETRPDLMFSAGLFSRYTTFSSNVHMGIARRVLRYLHETKVRVYFIKRHAQFV